MNILIYDGPGCSAASVSALKTELTRHLSPLYSIQSAGADILANEPWEAHTKLLVVPGGRDLPYLAALKGRAITRVKEYVGNGGRYLGVCAGAYFACSSIAFAEDDAALAVVGDRPLQLVRGRAVGPTFPGFEYHSEKGAHLAQLNYYDARGGEMGSGGVYVNGGCAFELHDSLGVVLATYAHNGAVAAYQTGNAVVTGLHPEFSLRSVPANLLVSGEDEAIVQKMEQARIAHFRTLLATLALQLKPVDEAKPEGLLPMVLAGRGVTEWVKSVTDGGSLDEHPLTIMNENGNDVLILHTSGGFSVHAECDRIAHSTNTQTDVDFNKQTKHIYVFETQNIPTPKFDIRRYFSHLQSAHVGRVLLYGEAVTSTQTLLDKNLQLLRKCPHGFLGLASHQLAGRGRGKNAWVSSSGCLQFSLVLRLEASRSVSVVFVQYLIGLAIVQALKSHDETLDIKLKWPNDIYAQKDGKLLKIGGILINSHFIDGQFVLVAGAGVNISNSNPTTCVNDVGSKRISMELATALIMSRIEDMWGVFEKSGFNEYLDDYYDAWLHSDQEMTIEHTSQKVRVAGITLDYGYLRTYPDIKCKVTPRSQLYEPVDLQPDGNSFDMLSGLIKVKK